jgi:hypothetical protein
MENATVKDVINTVLERRGRSSPKTLNSWIALLSIDGAQALDRENALEKEIGTRRFEVENTDVNVDRMIEK